jgi:hypothetical protein
MITPKDLYLKLVPHALAAYAQKTSDMESAKQMAHALAKECVDECARLGIIDAGIEQAPYARSAPQGAPVGAPGIPTFVEPGMQAGPASALVPSGAPQQPAQHYNHVPLAGSVQGQPTGGAQPMIGGQQFIPPAGEGYQPPLQAGVMGTVTHVPTPDGHSALGTGGVISQPVQRPSGKDVVINPQQKPMIPSIGGSGTTFVPEKISH